MLLDTAPGHRFIVDRLGRIETASGLKFRIGRIEGSVFGKSRLKNVAVSDNRGVFLTSPEIVLDWAPGAWLYNSLHIDELTSRQVRLTRLPKLRPTGRTGPILPGFDIHIGELVVDRLELGPAITGEARSGRVRGKADVRAGRAMVELGVAVDGGDRIALSLDAEPDRDRFDIDLRARSPANGLLPSMLGTKGSVDLDVGGDGSWTRWRGRAALDLAGRQTVRLGAWRGFRTLPARGPGRARCAPQGQAAAADLAADPGARRRPAARPGARRPAVLELAIDSRRHARRARPWRQPLPQGQRRRRPVAPADIVSEHDRPQRPAGVDARRPVRPLRLRLPADFAGVEFDKTGFVDVRAEGRGKGSPWPMRVPLRLSARAVTGVGDVAGAILANVRLEGMLTVTPKFVRGEGLKLTSNKLNGKIALLIDLATGRFEILISGGLARYAIPGLGIVDVLTELKVVPGPGGKGSRVVGTAKAWVRRLDNSFFRDLAGGLPRIETNLERGNDGIFHLTNLQLFAPKLRLSGAGRRNRDGTFHIEARGRQAKYGTLRMTLDGRIERPRDRPVA